MHSRDKQRLFKLTTPEYSKEALLKDICNAIVVGEGSDDRWLAAQKIDQINSRLKKPARRALWNFYYQIAETYALSKCKIGDKLKTDAIYEYASEAAVHRYRVKQKNRIAFEQTNTLILPGGKSPDGTFQAPKEVEISKVCRTPERQLAEMYCVMRGMEKYADSQGWNAYFWTFTAPGTYHSNPANASKNYRGHTPLAAHDWIAERFAKVRALFSKHGLPLVGLRVVEVHKDGTPHWHVILFYPPDYAKDFEQLIKQHLSNAKCTARDSTHIGQTSDHAQHDPSEQLAPRCTARDRKTGSAATYAFKYLLKTQGTSDSGEAVRAQLALWGIRQYAFYGNINISLWRKLRSAPDFEQISQSYPDDDNVSPRSRLIALWRAARRGDYYSFISLNKGLCKSTYSFTKDEGPCEPLNSNTVGKISPCSSIAKMISELQIYLGFKSIVETSPENLTKPDYELGKINPAGVPWPIKYISQKLESNKCKERLPVGFDGWMLKNEYLASQTIADLDFSVSPNTDQKRQSILKQIVTVIQSGSRKSKTTSCYTSFFRCRKTHFWQQQRLPVNLLLALFISLLIAISFSIIADFFSWSRRDFAFGETAHSFISSAYKTSELVTFQSSVRPLSDKPHDQSNPSNFRKLINIDVS